MEREERTFMDWERHQTSPLAFQSPLPPPIVPSAPTQASDVPTPASRHRARLSKDQVTLMVQECAAHRDQYTRNEKTKFWDFISTVLLKQHQIQFQSVQQKMGVLICAREAELVQHVENSGITADNTDCTRALDCFITRYNEVNAEIALSLGTRSVGAQKMVQDSQASAQRLRQVATQRFAQRTRDQEERNVYDDDLLQDIDVNVDGVMTEDSGENSSVARYRRGDSIRHSNTGYSSGGTNRGRRRARGWGVERRRARDHRRDLAAAITRLAEENGKGMRAIADALDHLASTR